jgi:predicted DNA-binding transcriptional regulator YafY
MIEIKRNNVIEFDYVNYRGEFAKRKVMVQRFFYGQTEYHPKLQWLLEGFDLDKSSTRTFAMCDISNVVRSN